VTDSRPRAQEDDPPDDDDLEELVDDLEDLEATADSPAERRAIRDAASRLRRLSTGRIFGVDDLAQQAVGGIILSAPFVVTEEVWSLAAGMNAVQWAITVFMVVVIGYGTLYRADDDRDPDSEESIAGLPTRFVSLLLVSYLSVTVLAFVFDAPATFGAAPATTGKAISIGAIFSVVGAATADSLF
jgi:uncharacterized membrane protein